MMNNNEWLFPVGQPVRVEYNDTSGRFTIYKAYLGLFEDELLQLGFEFNELPIINPGSELIIVVAQEAELYYRAKVIDVFFGQGIITVSRPQRTDVRAMRRFFRCEASFPVTLDTGTKALNGYIKNISAGGILAEVQNPGRLICGMRLSCTFLLPGSQLPIAVRGDIVRVNQEVGGATFVAIRFTVIHEKNRKEILQYQYRYQRESIKKDGPQ